MPGPFDQGWPTIVVGASGPSFSAEQAALIERAQAEGRCRVLAVNTTGPRRLPTCDALYASDRIWWANYIDEVRQQCPRAQLWTQDKPSAAQYGLRHIPIARRLGLSKDFGTINNGGNSGYSSIGLAYLFGARRIILVGFDMQRQGGRADGRVHFFGDHIGKGADVGRMHNTPNTSYAEWVPRFMPLAGDLAAAGVDVINCTGTTALTCFTRADLATTLDALP